MSACPKPMSKSEARRLIKAGAVEINGVKVTDPHALVVFEEGQEHIVRVGKRMWCRFYRERLTFNVSVLELAKQCVEANAGKESQ